MLSEKEFKALERVVRQAIAENGRDTVAHRPQLFDSKEKGVPVFKQMQLRRNPGYLNEKET